MNIDIIMQNDDLIKLKKLYYILSLESDIILSYFPKIQN